MKLIQIGGTEAWIWVAIEPVHRDILGVYISIDTEICS
jgi:hypothetical protein